MFIIVALSSYFLGGISVVLDKFLLGSKRISSPPVYAFYIAVLGLFILVLAPFGFYIPSIFQIFISLLSGAFFSLGILFLYFAIQKSEASRVSPVVGAVIPILTYFLTVVFLTEKIIFIQLGGIFLLIFGGLLISFDLPLKISKRKFFAGFRDSLWAGALLALAYFLFKLVYGEQSFINGFIWTRIGAGLTAIFYFFIPQWRHEILGSFQNFKKPKTKEIKTGSLFLTNKIIGGLSSVFLNYAIALGSVTIVNSLVSTQYVFILILASLAHKKYPSVFGEKLYFWDWAQKVGAIILIGIGIVLIY